MTVRQLLLLSVLCLIFFTHYSYSSCFRRDKKIAKGRKRSQSSAVEGSSNVFNTNEKFGEKNFGIYTVRNNIWGENHGTQTLTANSESNWSLLCNHGSSGGVKSYPHSGFPVNKTLGSIKSLTSTYAVKVESPGGTLAYCVSYDVWLQNHKYEIMVWMKWEGQVGPIGVKVEDDVKIAGYVFTVHKGSNGYNKVFSFLSKTQKESGVINLYEIMMWIDGKQWFTEGINETVVDEVQFGFEITSTPENAKFMLKRFRCSLDKTRK